MQVKPGCIAEVVGLTKEPNDNGRYVRVVKKNDPEGIIVPCTDGSMVFFDGRTGTSWVVEVGDRPLLVHNRSILVPEVARVSHAFVRCFYQRNLRPITDPDADLSETTEKEKDLEKVT